MKTKTLTYTAIAAVLALGSAVAFTSPSVADGPKGGPGFASGMTGGQGPQGMMNGQGHDSMMGKMMNKAGWKGRHHDGDDDDDHRGKGYGHHGDDAAKDLNLDADGVKKIIEGRLTRHGNDRLKVGKVEVKDDKTIIAEIVTVDDSLVSKLEFDRKTGRHQMVK